MDDDFDIYENLPLTCDIKDNGARPKNNEDLSKKYEELKKEVTELTSKLHELQKINETLEVNLSSLLKTAKAEIARKDKMIDELRSKVDNMSFRRGRFDRNRREINSDLAQQIPVPRTQELDHIQFENENLTIQNVSFVQTNPNVNQVDQEQNASSYERFSNHCHDTKYRFTSSTESFKLTTTVFTERLRKRIIEEEEEERRSKFEEKEKQNLLLENNHENIGEINIDDKENQSQFSIWNSNVDNTNLRYIRTDHDYIDSSNNVEDNAAYIENQQRLALSTKVSGKRIDHDTDVPSNKRRKLEAEQNPCISKHSLPSREDAFNGYDDGIMPNTSMNKLDYEENSNSCIEWNDPYCDAQYDRDNFRFRSNDGYYKRREHHKKCSSDYNYSKDSTYHEKDKYNRTRNRSPVPRYSDRKYKYHDERYKDHRDRYDRRRNFHDKEEDTSVISNKKCYDLRNKDRDRCNGKYNSVDLNSSRKKGSRCSDSRTSRSVSHERSKSSSKEMTSHKIYDRRSSKCTRHISDLENRANVSKKKKDEISVVKAKTVLKKTDISEKLVKPNSTESLENSKIRDISPTKSNINIENKEIVNVARESIIVDINTYKSVNESVSSKPVDVHTTNSHAFIKEKDSKNLENEKNENNDQINSVEDIIVNITTNVNISSETTHIPLVENKQGCMATTAGTIIEKDSKSDEYIVQHRTPDKQVINTCDNMQNFPQDVSNNITVMSSKFTQQSNATCNHNVAAEELNVCNNLNKVGDNTFSNEIHEKESNASENKHSLSKNNLKNQTPLLNDLQEPSTSKPLQKNEENDRNGHVKSKETDSKKASSERGNSKIIILARRRKRVQLVDNNASMTILVTANNANSDTDLKNNTENNLKLRACKISRSYKDVS